MIFGNIHKVVAIFAILTMVLIMIPGNDVFASGSNKISSNPNNNEPINLEENESQNQDKPRIELVSSSIDEIILDVNIRDLTMIELEVDGTTFTRFYLPNSGTTTEIGKPELPTFGKFFAVPNGASMSVEVLESEYINIPNVLVYPAQEPEEDCYTPKSSEQDQPPFMFDKDFYKLNIMYPEQPVKLDDVFIIRGVSTSTARFFPVQYNPGLQELTIFSYMRVRIRFAGGSRSIGDISKRAESFDNVFQNFLINYDQLEPVDFENIQYRSEIQGTELIYNGHFIKHFPK